MPLSAVNSRSRPRYETMSLYTYVAPPCRFFVRQTDVNRWPSESKEFRGDVSFFCKASRRNPVYAISRLDQRHSTALETRPPQNSGQSIHDGVSWRDILSLPPFRVASCLAGERIPAGMLAVKSRRMRPRHSENPGHDRWTTHEHTRLSIASPCPTGPLFEGVPIVSSRAGRRSFWQAVRKLHTASMSLVSAT